MSARRVVGYGTTLAVVAACAGWYAVKAVPVRTPSFQPAGDPFRVTLGVTFTLDP